MTRSQRNDHPIGKDTAAWVEESIWEFIGSDKNSFGNGGDERIFGKPLIGFSRGDDLIFDEFKNHIGNFLSASVLESNDSSPLTSFLSHFSDLF